MQRASSNCQVSRSFFNRITSHLRKSDPSDMIELALFEEDLDVCN